MKILIFYQYFGTPKGGWSTRIYEFAKRWVESGHEVTVITSPYYKSDLKTDRFISKQEIQGIKLVVINTPDSNKDSFLKRAMNAAVFSALSIYYALTLPHDIALSSSGPISVAIPGLLSKGLRNKKFVFEIRDLWPRGGIELGKIKNPIIKKLGLWFEKLCYRKADLVVCCSAGMEEGVHSILPGTKTLVIPNSCDVNLFNIETKYPSNFPSEWEGKKIFIYTGSLGLMDDCSQIIRGVDRLESDDYRIAFIGDGAEKEVLFELTKSLGLERKIKFFGLISKIEVVEWYSIAMASFVTFKDFPVLHTSSPNKMFDSFAAGIPIIQSTKGWIHDLVNKESCGINVLPNVPQTFANAIQLLGEDEEIKNRFSLNAKRLASNRFNRDVLSIKYIENLNQIHLK